MVLFVGSLFNRRRLPDFIAAFAQATTDLPQRAARHRRRRPHLAAPGPGGDRGARTASRRAPSFDATLPIASSTTSTRAPRCSAFLSEYEGFGMTPLEALSAGVPSVVLDTAGRARGLWRCGSLCRARRHRRHGRRFSPAADRSRRARRRSVRRRRLSLRRYSWDTAADRTLEHLERIAPAMTLSIIIVSYNARDDLERCLESLHAAPPGDRRTTSPSSTMRRPRVDSRRSGLAGRRSGSSHSIATVVSPPATTPAFGRRAASGSCCSTATRSSRAERSTRLSRASSLTRRPRRPGPD